MLERVLLTGASGFVGKPLAAALHARGIAVDAITRDAHPPALPGVRWHQADLMNDRERQAVLRDLAPTHLVHAAWYVAHGLFWQSPENSAWLTMSKHLAEEFAHQGGQRFVGVGTCAEYAWQDLSDAQPWPETRRIAPSTPYGQAKAALAAHVQRLAGQHPGLQVAWARLFMLFGPDEQPQRLVPSVLHGLLSQQGARCGSGRPVRDFASTWYVAQALVALLCSEVVGEVNVCSGQAVSTAQVAQLTAQLLGAQAHLHLGALPDPPQETPYMVGDNRRLRDEVGFTTAFDLQADLLRLIALYKNPIDTQGTKAITNSASSSAPK